MRPVVVGCIGCGSISGQYLSMGRNFPAVRITACADLDRGRAAAAAQQHGIERVMSPRELMEDPSIEIVLNLTVPKAHVPVTLAALEAGKHVYVEKPLGVSREEGRQVMQVAGAGHLSVGCAPDTFLGAGIQTCRKLIDEGGLGEITAFTAFMISRGHEHWHPSPEFYYEVGGGPMMDMGPYYLTALLNLLGGMKRVSGFASVAIPQRTITSEAKRGKIIEVETPDHYCGVIQFESGVVGSIIQSFAMRNAEYDGNHPIVIYGTEATLKVPDPNTFDGVPKVCYEGGDGKWHDVPHAFVTGYGRSVGLADMAHAIRGGRGHRCSFEQACCVLDAMQGFLDSSRSGHAHEIGQEYQRPSPMPRGLRFGQLD